MISKSDTVDDVELGGFVDAITGVVESITGPINSVAVTDTFSPCEASRVYLRRVPVLAVTSVKEYRGSTTYTLTNQPVGSATDVYGYSLDDASYGVVVRRSVASVEVPFGDIVVVTYTAGYATVPANVRLAALELIRENWVGSKNPGRRPPAEQQWDVNGFYVPQGIRELLRPNAAMPGIA